MRAGWIALLYCLALSACGGGGGGGDPPAAQPAPPPAPAPTVTAPSALTYTKPSAYTVGVQVNALTPVVNGTVTTYTVSPALPAGLVLDPATGRISGTPTSSAAAADYVITATNSAGSTTFALSITVNAAPPPPAPTLTISAAASPIAQGASAALTWASTGTQTCTASAGWGGSKAIAGTEQVGPLQINTTFTLSCSGPGGTIVRSVAVTVLPLPGIELTPNRTKVVAGVKADIAYRITNATQCTPNSDWLFQINGGGVGSTISGTRTVGPLTADTDFGLTCTNVVGQTTASVRIALETGPNQPPVAVDDTYSILEHTSSEVSVPYSTLVANDSDPEGRLGPLEYTEWNLTGGSSSVGALLVGQPAIAFTLQPNAVGPITFRYRIEDEVGQKSNYATLTVTITPVDDQPVAVSDTASGIRDLTFDIDVTQNDEDLDLPLTIQVSAAPTRATATVVTAFGEQVVRYTPNAGYEGADTFQYLLTDADGDTATATVAVTVGPAMRISPAARFARLGVARPQDWTCVGASQSAQLWSRSLYGYFKDSFDFIVLLDRATSTCNSGIAGQHVASKNDVTGIGSAIFDHTSLYGSAGRLRGVLWLANTSYLLSGPSLHEIAHNWANHIAIVEPAGVGPHWGYSSGGGQLGGFALSTLEDLGGGLYRANSGRPGATSFGANANGGNGVPYSELELYLMGLREPAGVPDLVIARGVTAANPPAPGTFNATSLERLTIQDIIAQKGARAPSFATSPKEFRVLTVVVTNSEMSQSEYDSLDLQVEQFGRAGDDNDVRYNFWEATYGVGRLLMERIDQELK